MPNEDIYAWSKTASSNSNSDGAINWAENQPRASVNNSARSMMAAHAKYRDMIGGIATGGVANAYTLTTGVGYTTIPNVLRVTGYINVSNTGPSTLAVDSAPAANITSGGAPLVAGDLLAGTVAEFIYIAGSSTWQMIGTPKVNRSGDTMTGDLTIAKAGPTLNLQKQASGQGSFIQGSTGANPRWLMQLGGPTAETGSDLGSDFHIGRYSDAGVSNTAFSISRQTGASYFGGDISTIAGSVFSVGHVNATFDVTAGRDLISTRNVFSNADVTATSYVRSNGHIISSFDITAGRNGLKPGGGAWADSSDARIKDVVGNYSSGLDAIAALQPVRYTFKGNDSVLVRDVGKEHIGLVAQDAEEHMPEMVFRSIGKIDGEDVNDLRMLDPSALTFALVNCIKELLARIEALEAKIA